MPYYVYVIELDNAVLQSKKFRENNPHLKYHKSCFYVGQSTHTPEVRFEQHKQGYKSNRFVKKYGVRLRKRLYKKYNPIHSRDEALAVEQYLAHKLRSKGHGVWSN